MVGSCIVIIPASAQQASSTTYVASIGQNKGTCTRTAPCLSFAYAIGQTPAGGEIVALDTSGFGPVTITKAITISSGGPGRAYIGNVANGGNAITISAGAGDAVHLRGLQIVGGATGINVASAGSLDISDVAISGTSSAGLVNSASATAIAITDALLVNNSSGLDIEAGSVVIKGVHVTGGTVGIFVATSAQVVDCTIEHATGQGIRASGGSLVVKGSTLTGNQTGLEVDNGATARIDTTTVTGNTTGVVTTGTAMSYGNNNISGNGTNIVGTVTPVAQD